MIAWHTPSAPSEYAKVALNINSGFSLSLSLSPILTTNFFLISNHEQTKLKKARKKFAASGFALILTDLRLPPQSRIALSLRVISKKCSVGERKERTELKINSPCVQKDTQETESRTRIHQSTIDRLAHGLIR